MASAFSSQIIPSSDAAEGFSFITLVKDLGKERTVVTDTAAPILEAFVAVRIPSS